MNKIFELFNGLERFSTKWNTYFDIYERHFSKFVNKSPTVLEIGIMGGGSLELWLKYFGEGTKIVGVDINPINPNLGNNVITEVGDQSSPEFWDRVLSKHPKFDIVVDDGGHSMIQQVVTLNKVFPHLNDNGVFLIEDTHTSYWKDWGGNYYDPNTMQNRAKQLTDVMNKNHMESNYIPENVLKTFDDLYSISFYNSVVVFEKKKVEQFTIVERGNKR